MTVVRNCSSLHLITVWLSCKPDHMDLIWCCMYFKESITILYIWYQLTAAQYTIYHLCSCVWKVQHSQCLQIINTALSFTSWCIYFSPCTLVLYNVHSWQRCNNYVEYNCWLSASSALSQGVKWFQEEWGYWHRPISGIYGSSNSVTIDTDWWKIRNRYVCWHQRWPREFVW